jgi:hypothetical protein
MPGGAVEDAKVVGVPAGRVRGGVEDREVREQTGNAGRVVGRENLPVSEGGEAEHGRGGKGAPGVAAEPVEPQGEGG